MVKSGRSVLRQVLLVGAIVGHLAVDTVPGVVQLGLVRRHLEHLVAEVSKAAIVVGAGGVPVVDWHLDLLRLTGEAQGWGLDATRDEDLAIC